MYLDSLVYVGTLWFREFETILPKKTQIHRFSSLKILVPKEEKTLVWYFWLYTTLTLVICRRILLHNLYLLARTMIIKRYWRSSTYVVVCAIASDNAIKISNPTESFKIQTKAVVWPAKIKVIQDYNIRLNEKKNIKREVLEYSDTCLVHSIFGNVVFSFFHHMIFFMMCSICLFFIFFKFLSCLAKCVLLKK